MISTPTQEKSIIDASGLAQRPPRERILFVSREMFYRNGIHAVGVEAIAEAALTNKMTLYRHFKSKEELVVAYVKELASEGDAVWQGICAAHPDDPDARLEAWVDYVENILTNNRERGCALANAAVELQPEHPARKVIEDYKQRKRENLMKLFKEARYRDPKLLADEVFLLFEGARISIQCGGKGPALQVVKMLRNLLSKAPRLSSRAQRTA